jgi:hypothetical protein
MIRKAYLVYINMLWNQPGANREEVTRTWALEYTAPSPSSNGFLVKSET